MATLVGDTETSTDIHAAGHKGLQTRLMVTGPQHKSLAEARAAPKPNSGGGGT